MSKKLLSYTIFIFVILTAPFSAKAAEDFIIENFESNIIIQNDGKVSVEEKIDVFFYEARHGIYRDLPFAYESDDGEKTYTEIKIISVTDGFLKIPYEVSSNQANLRIKIGDPNKTISGPQKYIINYSVAGILVSFDDYDELYWNVTGDKWLATIKNSSVTVTLPEAEIIQEACYVGKYGETNSCSINKISEKEVQFVSKKSLAGGEGLTIAVGYTKGMVPILTITPPKTIEDVISSSTTLIVFSVTFVTGLFLLLRKWWQIGRDRFFERKSLHDPDQIEKIFPIRAYEAIGAEYDSPLNLRPAEIGVLMDERADTLDISATIVDLAIRGYLTIEEKPKKWKFGDADYILAKTDKNEEGLMDYEKKLLSSLFLNRKTVKLSELKKSFYKHLGDVKNALYEEVTNKKLFAKNPQSTRTKYLLLAMLLFFTGLITTVIGVRILNSFVLGLGFGLDGCGIVFIIISFLMPRRTAFGREIYRKARGYKLFVSGTEKYRQPFFEKENVFMEVLPYAIIFGVTKKLANAMEEMGIKPPQPSWYVGSVIFNPSRFMTNMDSFSSSLSSAIASTPSSSGSGGSGFSGGGFGGGGGGSW